jgi:UDP-N-acetylglucosamine 2-epimerase (non-hydrolysing)
MVNICGALKEIARSFPDAAVVYPVHPNPNVRGPVSSLLNGVANVHLIDPLDYRTFVYLMARANVILTDSGGIQEEAPSLGIPVLVMRDVTERVEAIEAGVAELVGTSTSRIVERTTALLQRPKTSQPGPNPFGDGRAAERIVRTLAQEPVRIERDLSPLLPR